MTVELHGVADPRGLWPALSTFAIGSDPPHFARRLASENGWSEAYADRVIEEYRRFLHLASLASFELTPSQAVDAVWHLHLEDETHYRDVLCAGLLGRDLRHLPGSGEAGEEERFRTQYRATIALYEKVFGSPPGDIWPSPAQPEVDEPEPRQFPDWAARLAAIAMPCGIAAALVGNPPLAALLLAGGGSVLLYVFAAPGFGRRRRRHANGSCGGGCAAGCASAEGDGGASCGGACGGGD